MMPRDEQESWEHELAQMYASLNAVLASARDKRGADARVVHEQLVRLEQNLMSVTQIVAQQMDKD